MRFPNIIENTNEEYITLPALKAFSKANGIPIENRSANATKSDFIKAVSDFADSAPNNQELVLDWIDSVVKEGIKEIQITHFPLKPEIELLFSTKAGIQRHLDSYLSGVTPHLTGNTYGNNFDLIRYDISESAHGKYISFLFCRMLRYHDIRTGRGGIVEYPVFVDYYYELGWLMIRFKSRSGLYDLVPEGTPFDEFLRHSISLNSEIAKIYKRISSILSFDRLDSDRASIVMRSKFYKILDKYTQTPTAIVDVIDKNRSGIDDITASIMRICNLHEPYKGKVETDIQNLFEKYLSVTWPDKDVFIQDREAYPVRLSTTDEEESKVDQSSAAPFEPLQSKEVFFDNKRMLHAQHMCDSITLVWKRTNRTYYSEPFFPVRFAEKGGKCTLSFKKYAAEEDIERVLFAIIDA